MNPRNTFRVLLLIPVFLALRDIMKWPMSEFPKYRIDEVIFAILFRDPTQVIYLIFAIVVAIAVSFWVPKTTENVNKTGLVRLLMIIPLITGLLKISIELLNNQTNLYRFPLLILQWFLRDDWSGALVITHL